MTWRRWVLVYACVLVAGLTYLAFRNGFGEMFLAAVAVHVVLIGGILWDANRRANEP